MCKYNVNSVYQCIGLVNNEEKIALKAGNNFPFLSLNSKNVLCNMFIPLDTF